ncbi:MAG: hypothetical protein ABIE75_02880 [Candidatus Omnitrophota bacterium]
MAWIIGGWRILNEGEVHQVVKKCINILVENKFQLTTDLVIEQKEIEYGRELYEILRDFEKHHGVNDLLEVLTAGLKIKCLNHSNRINIEIILRTPSGSEERRQLFKDMVSAWVEENTLTFSERFFRLPKVSEDFADRYLDNPLEQTLKRTFGFHFQYKVVIKYEGDGINFERLRKKLYKALR